MQLKEIIKAEMTHQGLSARQLAFKAGIKREQTVQDWLAHKKKDMYGRYIEKLLIALNFEIVLKKL